DKKSVSYGFHNGWSKGQLPERSFHPALTRQSRRVKLKFVAKHFARSCPRCAGYLGIIMRKPARNISLQAINGRCLQCGYRLAWILVQGRKSTALRVRTARRSSRYD